MIYRTFSDNRPLHWKGTMRRVIKNALKKNTNSFYLDENLNRPAET